MPDLPVKSLSQEHYDRVVAAFPGTTLAQKAAAYDAWLTNHLIDYVERVEANRIDEAAHVTKRQQLEALTASLPQRVQFPPTAG